MSRPKVFATRMLPKEAHDILLAETDLEVWPEYTKPPQDVLLSKVTECEGLLSTIEDVVNEEVLTAGRDKLRVVANFAVGYNNLDVATATRLGIAVSNTPNVLEDTTADLAFALLMATARRLTEGDRDARLGEWRNWHPFAYVGMDIHHAALSIIGLGQIGLAVMKRAMGFEMEIYYHSRTRKPVIEKQYGIRWCPDLNSALEVADYISLHTPLTPATQHMIGKDQFARMKPTAILINTARGALIDHAALFEAVRDEVIWGVGLDVTDPEPLPPESPLFTLRNVVITPHVGSSSMKTRTAMAVLAARNILASLRGEEMPSCVNPVIFEKFSSNKRSL